MDSGRRRGVEAEEGRREKKIFFLNLLRVYYKLSFLLPFPRVSFPPPPWAPPDRGLLRRHSAAALRPPHPPFGRLDSSLPVRVKRRVLPPFRLPNFRSALPRGSCESLPGPAPDATSGVRGVKAQRREPASGGENPGKTSSGRRRRIRRRKRKRSREAGVATKQSRRRAGRGPRATKGTSHEEQG